MKPVESLRINPAQVTVQELAEIIAAVHAKLNDLIQAHNELLAKYESHHHHQDEDAMPGTTGEPQND